MDLETQWAQFMNEDFNVQEMESYDIQLNNTVNISSEEEQKIKETDVPECSPLNISTKTKIIYLNSTFNLNELFWQLKTINYDSENDGILKNRLSLIFSTQLKLSILKKILKMKKM